MEKAAIETAVNMSSKYWCDAVVFCKIDGMNVNMPSLVALGL